MLPTGLGRGATFPSFVPSRWLACICVPFFPPSDHPGRPEEEGYTCLYWEESVHRLSSRCHMKLRPKRRTINSIVACYALFSLGADFGNTENCTTVAVVPPVTAGFHDIELGLVIIISLFFLIIICLFFI